MRRTAAPLACAGMANSPALSGSPPPSRRARARKVEAEAKWGTGIEWRQPPEAREPREEAVELREERAPDGRLFVDLLVVSHVDDDHINVVTSPSYPPGRT